MQVEYVSKETKARMQKIHDWLMWFEQRYLDLISRESETAALSGWDPDPRTRPCECKWEWRSTLGNVCLVCDNSRMRPLVRVVVDGQLEWEEGIDQYALGTASIKGGFTAKSAGDESEAQKRSAHLAAIDQQLDKLARDARIRAGLEAQGDRFTRAFDAVRVVPHSMEKIKQQCGILLIENPVLHARLPNSDEALLWLARRVRGRLSRAGSPS